jgi:hypothetical protein
VHEAECDTGRPSGYRDLLGIARHPLTAASPRARRFDAIVIQEDRN